MSGVEKMAWKIQEACISHIWLLRRETELTRKDREKIARLLEELWRCHTPRSIRFMQDAIRQESSTNGVPSESVGGV